MNVLCVFFCKGRRAFSLSNRGKCYRISGGHCVILPRTAVLKGNIWAWSIFGSMEVWKWAKGMVLWLDGNSVQVTHAWSKIVLFGKKWFIQHQIPLRALLFLMYHLIKVSCLNVRCLNDFESHKIMLWHEGLTILYMVSYGISGSFW